MHLTAAQAQALLSEYTIEEVRLMFSEESELSTSETYVRWGTKKKSSPSSEKQNQIDSVTF